MCAFLALVITLHVSDLVMGCSTRALSPASAPITQIRSSPVGACCATQNRPPFPQRYLPGLWVLRKHQRSWLRGDLLAGVTVAAYLVPQMMAYAEVAGLPAITTLWGGGRPMVLYAVLGSSARYSVGPGVQHRADDRSCCRHSHVR